MRGRIAAVLLGVWLSAASSVQGGAVAAELRVGNIASTSNPTAKLNSANLATGYEVYFEHVNRQGGVNGNTLKLVQLDDEVNPQKMVELTNKLIDDPKVIALAGFLNSPGIGLLAKDGLLQKRGIALVAPISGLISMAPNFFPLRATYYDELDAVIDQARQSGKRKVAVVYFNQAFGPAMFKHAQGSLQRAGLELVASASFETAPDKINQQIREASASVAKAMPDAVIVLAGGVGVYDFVKAFRGSPAGLAQIYALSPVDALTLVKAAGIENAKGVIIAQSVPFPEGRALKVVREYQDLMKRYAPDKPFTYFGLEGFMGAKILVEGLRRAGNDPSRTKLINALRGLKYYDLGDFEVNYAEMERWRKQPFVELSIIGSSGKLFR